MSLGVYILGALISALIWKKHLKEEISQGFDIADKTALVVMILIWPVTWLAIAVLAILDWRQERDNERK